MISQILAVIIFLAMFILIITEVWERHIVTLGCALLTLVVIFGICMFLLMKWKMNPIFVMVLAGILNVIQYFVVGNLL